MNTRNARKNLYIFAIITAMFLNACEDRHNPDTRMIVTLEQCVTAPRCDRLMGEEYIPVPEACPCDMFCIHGEQMGCTTAGYFCDEGCMENADCLSGRTCVGGICTTEGVTAENEGTCSYNEETQIRVEVPVDVDIDVVVTENPPLPVCGNGICETGETFNDCPSDCFCDNDGVCEPGHGENQNNCLDCVGDPVDYDADNDGFDRYPYGNDCNDQNAAINPGATEICNNSVDEDCDGVLNNGCAVDRDLDNDGYDAVMFGGDDCNDQNAAINPGATEICGNSVDEDCDGVLNNGCTVVQDMDNDGYDAVQYGGDDCNDNDASINPGATEICNNSVDEDCDGVLNNGCTVDHDLDNDGYDAVMFGGDDCNDQNPNVHPGATEVCNGIDDDCDGLIDEDDVCPIDMDNDGFARPPHGDDCNDLNPSIHPGATEVCNGVDDDCDGLTDEDGVCEQECLTEGQGDGPGPDPMIPCCPGLTQILCLEPVGDQCLMQVGCSYFCTYCGNSVCKWPENKCNCAQDCDKDGDGYQVDTEDCNDLNPSIHPGATEICGNNIDEDCDGLTDEGCPVCGNGICEENEDITCPQDCISPVCDHDNVIDLGEECDDQNMGGHSCADVGHTHGEVYCFWADCTVDYSNCWTPASELCDHDNVIDPGEECDDQNMGGHSCADVGHSHGQVYCFWADCTVDYSSCWTPASESCDHDGIVEPSQGEECDDWNMDGKSCEDFPPYTGGTLYCYWDSCKFDFSSCTGPVGDDLWVARKDGDCIEINPYYMSMVDPNQTDTVVWGFCPQAGLGDWSVNVQIFDSDGDGWGEYCPPDGAASSPICRMNAKYYDPADDNNWAPSQFESCCYRPDWLEVCGPYLHCGWEQQQDGNMEYVGNIMFNAATSEGAGYIEPY